MANKPTLKEILPQLMNWCTVNNVSVQSVYDRCHGFTLQELVYYLFGVVKQTVVEIIDYENEFEALYNFVNDYFKNLDVQDEINNKLDDMYEDGSLLNLLKPYLIKDYFETASLMCTDKNLQNGMVVFTSFRNNTKNGGSGLYYITSGKTANGYDILQCQNNLVAVLIPTSHVSIEQLGAVENTSISAIMQYSIDAYNYVYSEGGYTYTSNAPTFYKSQTVIDMNYSWIFTENVDAGSVFSNIKNSLATRVTIKNCYFNGKNNTFRNPFIYLYVRDVKTESVSNVSIHGCYFANNIGSGIRAATNYEYSEESPSVSYTTWRAKLSGINVYDCVANNVSCGYSFFNARYARVSNCVSFNSKAEGILFDVFCYGCVADGNIIITPKGGVGCFGCDSPSQCIFSNNVCVSPVYYHIRVNTIRNTPGNGIAIIGNTFYDHGTATGYTQAIAFTNVTGVESMESDNSGTPARISGNSYFGDLIHAIHCSLDCDISYNDTLPPDINYSKTHSNNRVNDVEVSVNTTAFTANTEVKLNLAQSSTRIEVNDNVISTNNNSCTLYAIINFATTPTSDIRLRIYNASGTALRTWYLNSRSNNIIVPAINQSGIYFTVQSSDTNTVASDSEIHLNMP